MLTTGTRIGPYEIVGEAGAGGMGTVYRARDTRLGRAVAIKIIGAAAAFDPDAERRFAQERRLAAALVHPRICTVYDVGNDLGLEYLVLEFLEGRTVAARLCDGKMMPAE